MYNNYSKYLIKYNLSEINRLKDSELIKLNLHLFISKNKFNNKDILEKLNFSTFNDILKFINKYNDKLIDIIKYNCRVYIDYIINIDKYYIKQISYFRNINIFSDETIIILLKNKKLNLYTFKNQYKRYLNNNLFLELQKRQDTYIFLKDKPFYTYHNLYINSNFKYLKEIIKIDIKNEELKNDYIEIIKTYVSYNHLKFNKCNIYKILYSTNLEEIMYYFFFEII